MHVKQIAKEILTDEGQISSARVINVLGAVTGTVLLVYHGMWLGTLDAEVFGIYMGYCAGVYGVGKYMDRRYKEDRDDRYNTNNDEGYQDYGNRSAKYNRYDDPDQ